MPMSPRLLRPRASGAFDPRSIAGLELWIDFGDSATLTLSGSAISEARDKSGRGWVASQSTGANQPTLTANAINGRSVASFDGSNDSLRIASFADLGDITAFAVAYRPWATAAYRIIASTSSYSSTDGVGLFLHTGAVTQDWQAGDMVAVGEGANSGRAPRAIGPLGVSSNNQPVIFSAVLSASSVGLWRNGTSIGTRVSTAGATTTPSGTFSIGSSPLTDYWDGSIAEFLLYKAALNTTQIKSVEAWLSGRYKITVA